MEREHKIKLNLDNGASLELLLFSHDEHRWFFEYNVTKRKDDDPRGDVVLSNDIRLVAEYHKGILQHFKVSMHLINHDKLGKKFYVGLDISPGAKLYMEYFYVPSKSTEESTEDFVLDRIEARGETIKIEDGLIPGDKDYFLLPLKIEIGGLYGHYEFPFITDSGMIDHFIFPKQTIR